MTTLSPFLACISIPFKNCTSGNGACHVTLKCLFKLFRNIFDMVILSERWGWNKCVCLHFFIISNCMLKQMCYIIMLSFTKTFLLIKFSVGDLFKTSELRRPLIICAVLQMSQQLSGINAVSFSVFFCVSSLIFILLCYVHGSSIHTNSIIAYWYFTESFRKIYSLIHGMGYWIGWSPRRWRHFLLH